MLSRFETDEICLLIYNRGFGGTSVRLQFMVWDASDISSAIELAPFAHLFLYFLFE